jgi:hypothetical protein
VFLKLSFCFSFFKKNVPGFTPELSKKNSALVRPELSLAWAGVFALSLVFSPPFVFFIF